MNGKSDPVRQSGVGDPFASRDFAFAKEAGAGNPFEFEYSSFEAGLLPGEFEAESGEWQEYGTAQGEFFSMAGEQEGELRRSRAGRSLNVTQRMGMRPVRRRIAHRGMQGWPFAFQRPPQRTIPAPGHAVRPRRRRPPFLVLADEPAPVFDWPTADEPLPIAAPAGAMSPDVDSMPAPAFDAEPAVEPDPSADDAPQSEMSSSVQPIPRLLKRESQPAQTTLYVEIKLKNRHSKTGQPVRPVTGIFIPERFRPTAAVDVVLYLHGHDLSGCNKSIETYWNTKCQAHFPLRQGLNAAGRNIILVAPTLGSKSEAGILTQAGELDQYLDQVAAALAAYGPFSGRTPRIGNLILACHSGGGFPMRMIALARNRYADQIRECWGFDCTYNRGDDTLWAQWAGRSPQNKVYIYYRPGSGTASRATALKSLNLRNVFVEASRHGHNQVPMAYWKLRLQGATFLKERSQQGSQRESAFELEAPPAATQPGSADSYCRKGVRSFSPVKTNELISIRGYDGRKVQMQGQAGSMLMSMIVDARAAGIPAPLLLPVNGYRSLARQQAAWQKALKKYGGDEKTARKWVCKPSPTCPHLSGLAVDLWMGSGISSGNADQQRQTMAYQWLINNARRYGFTGYCPEPWHWEYNLPTAKPNGAADIPGLKSEIPALQGPRVPAGFKLRNGTGPGGQLVPRGLARVGGGRLDKMLLELRKKGRIHISDQDIDTLQRIANVETDGLVQALNTWDSAVVSIGFMQWTLQFGELQNWIKNASGAFKRYGIELDNRSYVWKSGKQQAIKGALNKEDLRWNGWAERFYRAGLDPEIILAQVPLALLKLERSLKHLQGRLKTLNLPHDFSIFKGHYDQSLEIRGLFQEAYNNKPAAALSGTIQALKTARERNISATPAFLRLLRDAIRDAYRALGSSAESLILKTSKGAHFG